MTEKIKVSKEVAEAIEKYIHYWTKEIGKTKEEVKALLVGTHNELKYKGWDAYRDGSYKAMEGISTFDLMQVLVNGYEIEHTPEDKVREIYSTYNVSDDVFPVYFSCDIADVIIDVLDGLDIKIEGVNS